MCQPHAHFFSVSEETLLLAFQNDGKVVIESNYWPKLMSCKYCNTMHLGVGEPAASGID